MGKSKPSFDWNLGRFICLVFGHSYRDVPDGKLRVLRCAWCGLNSGADFTRGSRERLKYSVK